MAKKILLLIITLGSVMSLRAQVLEDCYQKDTSAYIRNHQVHFTRLKLEVSFVPQQALVKGRVTEYFTPLRKNVDTIYLNGPGIKLISCTLNGKPAAYDTTSGGIFIHCNPVLHWDTQDSITIVYEALSPKRGIYFYGWNDPKNILRKQIWTQGEGTDNRDWIPMYDEPNDKMITEMIVTFDKNYSVLSNGTKISEKLNADGTKTWHYRISHPISTYLIMLAIGDYAVKTAKSSSGVPMQYWYYPDEVDRVQPTYEHATDMMDFLESETGLKYPWESYSQVPVENYVFGAMENTTATIYGDFYFNDKRGTIDRAYAGVDAHEMTHQWFGDYVTCRSWIDMWMHESFATYYAKLYDTKLYKGEDYYVWNRRSEQNAAINASKSDLNPIRYTGAGTSRIYSKGSAVLDMLSYVTGHDAFKRAIHCYLVHNRYANVDIHDFTKAFKDTLGLDMDWFFKEWIERGGEPHYDVSYKIEKKNDGNFAVIDVKQTQKTTDVTGYFKMPINFEVYYNDGSRDSVQQWISHAEDSVVIPAKKQISFVLFDPDSWIIKSVNFNKSFAELQSQVHFAPHAIDRFDALVALRDSSINLKRNLLVSEFNFEQYHGMREEVVRQLTKDRDPNSIAILQKAFSDKDAGVRQAVISAIDTLTPQWQPYFEQALHDSSYTTEQEAFVKLCVQFPSNIQKYLDETRNDYGINNGLRTVWLEIKALHSSRQAEQDSAVAELTNYAGPSYEFRTRINALGVIKEMNFLTQAIVANLFDAALIHNWILAGNAKKLLDYFYEQPDKKKMIQDYYASQTFTPAEQKILSKYGPEKNY